MDSYGTRLLQNGDVWQFLNKIMAELNCVNFKQDSTLRAYLRMENGALITDASSYNLTLGNQNTVASNASGKFGYCSDFGNTGGHNKSITHDTNIMSTTNIVDMTVSCWVKIITEPLGPYRLFEINTNFSSTGSKIYCNYNNDGTLLAGIALTTADAGCIYSGGAFGTSVWHHVVFIKSGNTAKLYVDNVAVTPNTGTGDNASSASGTYMLSVANDRSLGSGVATYIDDFAVFERALITTEITKLYSGGCDTGGFFNFM